MIHYLGIYVYNNVKNSGGWWCDRLFFSFLALRGSKNKNSGTQRTEQSEVYGTKKEEKREKRRKSVHITIRNITYKSRHIPYL